MHKKFLRSAFKTSVLAAALTALPLSASAAGLGRMTVLSALGQPLRVEVELIASREELTSLSARLASHEAFKKAGIEFTPALAGIKLVVDKRAGGKPVIQLTTDRPVNEPFLDLLLELNWSAGRLVREYSFLLDPAPEVLARRPAAPYGAKGEAIAQPAPVTPPGQPEVRTPAPVEDMLPAKKSEEEKAVGVGKAREVIKGEYLRKIAAEVQHDGVSLDQMLVAIFRGNKEAFIGNNMHRLKAGKILAIPDRDTVAAVDVREARKTISAHTADFNTYRQKLAAAAAGTVAPKEEAARQIAAGKIGAKVADKVAAPAAEAKDQLRISKAEAAKDAQVAQGKIAALEEDLVAKDRALEEAQSRQADLEKNLKELQKLIELKNQNLAELQRQAQQAKAPPAAEAPPAPAPQPAPAPPAPAATAPAPVPAPAAPTAPAAVEKAAEKPAEPVKPAEAPKPAPKKAPPPPPEPGFLDELMENPAVLGGGVLVLGLLALLAYRQRQKKKQQEGGEAPPTTTANLTGSSVFGATGGRSIDTTGSSLATGFSQASISAIDAEEGVDPVAEADVYMAYGRDAQAEEILLDALKTDPTRTAIHLKLLEIYAGRRNLKQFETLASDLYSQTGGAGGDWEKAAAMGLKLDPANPLYGGIAAETRQAVRADTTAMPPVTEKPMRDTLTLPEQPGKASEAVGKGIATVVLERPVESAAVPPAAAPLDFDLDLGAPAEAAPEPPVSQPEPTPAKAETASGLDLDLGLVFEPVESQPAEAKPAEARPAESRPAESRPVEFSSEATMVMDVSKLAQSQARDLTLDIKLDETAAPAADQAMHFDLDLGAPAAPAAAETVDLEKPVAGGSALDFDFDLGAPQDTGPAPQGAPDIDLGAISLDLGAPAAAAEPAAGDEVATKIELAKAYEEMGDKEGARELLNEVAREGNAEQQARAQSMLARLS